MNVDNLHFRHIMLFKFREGATISATTKSICNIYGETAVTSTTVKKWFTHFRRDDFNLEDKTCSGRLIKVDDDLLINLITSNSRISTTEIAQKLNITYGNVLSHLKKLGYILKFGVWVPYALSEKNKLDRVFVANSLLGRLAKDPVLDRLVTGDTTWIKYNTIQLKRTWEQSNEPGQSVIKTEFPPGKAMLSIWWDCKGVIFYELLPVGETINCDKYCEQLDKLQAAIQEKRPVLANWDGVLFHYDNNRPDTSMQIARKLRQLKWDILLHPPYSPDIAPSDYYLFPSLQNNLNGKEFASFEALNNYISVFFDSETTTFYYRGIQMLPERCQKIIDNEGNYLIDEGTH